MTYKLKYCVCSQLCYMYEHGFYDAGIKKWYCSYFMSEEEWLDIHDYLPHDDKNNSFEVKKKKSDLDVDVH